MTHKGPLVEVEDLVLEYRSEDRVVRAVDGVSFAIEPEEILGIIGESGCGKSSLAYAIMGYLGKNGRVVSGDIRFQGESLLTKSARELESIRGAQMSLVYQDPYASLNPSLTIGRQLAEVIRFHRKSGWEEGYRQGREMLEKLNISDAANVLTRYPHQISGGMQQRVCIGMALLCSPSLLLMDEPTTALDATTEVVILDLIRELRDTFHTAILYISHNLGVVATLADRIAVMYLGKVAEVAGQSDIFHRPRHPYTGGLINCLPHSGFNKNSQRLTAIPGLIKKSNLGEETGCNFRARCERADQRCADEMPRLRVLDGGSLASCHYPFSPDDFAARPDCAGTEGENPARQEDEMVLSVREMKKYYQGRVKALDGVSLQVKRGRTLGIVGESGCGKSTLALGVAGLAAPTGGSIEFEGRDITRDYRHRARENPKLFRALQMVFQNPERSLNPSMTAGQTISRSIVKLLDRRLDREELKRRCLEIMGRVGLDASYYGRRPHQMSGGEKQRVAIARVFAAQPDLVICDEPTSALDVSVQAAVLNLLVDLQNDSRASYLFISHDLSVVRYLSDYVAVLYLGLICEYGPVADIFSPPFHPYTRALLSASPLVDLEGGQPAIRLTGKIPSPADPPRGCRFHTRCPQKIGAVCETEVPPERRLGTDHLIYCHLDF